VALFRKDYIKLQTVMEKELNFKKHFFQTQKTDKNYNWVFGRLRLNNTVYKRVGQEHLKHHDGIFIDIFPLDEISENKFKQFLTLIMCKLCKKALWSSVGIKNGKNFMHKLVFKLLSYIPRNLVISIYEYFAMKVNNRETSLIASHNAFSIVLKKSWYKDTVGVEFEGLKFSAPKNMHEFLKARYGDYMKLPPKEERVGHHYVSYIRYSDGEEIKKYNKDLVV